jgi:proteasome lid subunit RPN8/RPN11
MSHIEGGSGNRVEKRAGLEQDRRMLRLPYDCHRCLREDVEHAYPEEACGILLGGREEADEVVRVIACGNADPEPGQRYRIAPRELIAAQKVARQDELEILGFYHSHPDQPAEASETDLREAHWTGCVYLICGVEKGKLVHVAAVRLVGPEEWAAERVQFDPPDG